MIARYLAETKDKYQVSTTFFVSEKTANYYYPKGILKTMSASNSADKWYFRVRKLQEPYEINIDYDKANNNALAIFLNFRVFNQQQQYLGVTGVGLSMNRLYALLCQYEAQYQKNIYLVDSTGKVRLTGSNRLHDTRDIYRREGLKELAAETLARKKTNFQYQTENGHYLLHVQYMPEVRLFLFVESKEDNATSEVRQALYFNIMVWLAIVMATIVLTNMMVRHYQKELERMATIDHLTTLMNRQAFELVSQQMLAESRRHDISVAVLMMDIDYFKQVNDSYGHAAGDKVLEDVAHLLKAMVRESDMLCRWGGEEFVIFLHQCQQHNAERIAEQIRTTIAKHESVYGLYSLSVTLSVGVTVYRGSVNETLATVMARADAALYSAKQQGRNRVVVSI